MSEQLRQHDVERILRDVLNTSGVRVSTMTVEPTPTGWRVSLTDIGQRVLSVDIPAGRSAQVRTALRTWIMNVAL